MLDFGFYNLDCMEGMKQFPDKYFDLAIVDPPYGGGFADSGGWMVQQVSPDRTTDLARGSTATRVHRQSRNSRQPDGTWGYPKWSNEQTAKKL